MNIDIEKTIKGMATKAGKAEAAAVLRKVAAEYQAMGLALEESQMKAKGYQQSLYEAQGSAIQAANVARQREQVFIDEVNALQDRLDTPTPHKQRRVAKKAAGKVTDRKAA